MSTKLQDKIAFVTGAASGIGLAIAEIYAREGAKVAIADMNMAAAQAAAEKLKAQGATAMAVAADVSDEGQVNAAVDCGGQGLGRGRHPGEQRRHPDRPSARGVHRMPSGRR